MTYNLTTPENMAIRLPITSQAIQFAENFARQQPTPDKRERVNLNTLAVCVVNDYLEMMGFPTNLSGGDSWNPIVRMGADVADLELPGIGKLECRPVTPQMQEYQIPPEVWIDRLGYMFVEINLAAREATILGFIPQARAVVNRNQLRSPEDFIDHLHSLMTSPVIELHRWLEGAIEAGWQSVESLFRPAELAFRFAARSTGSNLVRQAKLIDWEMQLYDSSVALVVEILPHLDEEKTEVTVQVHPQPRDRAYLPPNLQLVILDESDNIFLEARSRTADNWIQLQFEGNAGEKFGVKLTLGAAEVREKFII
jgi:hypothetical protein